MTQRTDAELITASIGGDQLSFAELVARYQRRVAATIRSVIGTISQDDFADIAQDIFLIIYKALPSFRGEAQFGTYVTSIALRHCYREAKRRKRKSSTFLRFGSGKEDDGGIAVERFRGTDRADKKTLADERREIVLQALEELPEEFRTVMVMRIVEEMPVEQVAEVLGISAGTVKSRLYRAKERMKELLAQSELEFEEELLNDSNAL